MAVTYEPVRGVYIGLSSNSPGFVTIGLKLTNRCNLDCYHCCRYGDYPDMPFETATQLISRLAQGDVTRIHFTGGEPLLYKDLGRVIEYAKQQPLRSGSNFSLSLTTNGVLLTKEVAQSFREYLDSVKMSIFGVGQNYVRVTGGNPKTYDKALAGIRNAASEGIPVHAQTSVLRENIRDLGILVQAAQDLGATKFTLYSNIRQAKGIQLADTHLVPDHEIEKVFDKLVEEKIGKGWPIELRWLRWPQNGQYILVFTGGEVTANPVNNPPENFEVIGNLLERSVEELWSDYRYKAEHLRFYADRD